jgi:DNA-binding phage protein
MENLEEAAQIAAMRWKARESAKDEIRAIALELLKNKNMTEVARIIGISRTSLYYFLYGRDGKANSVIHPNERNLPVYDGPSDLRESA